MSDNIVLPSLSNDMVLTIFKYLVDAELRKHLHGNVDFRAGCQEGVVAALAIMFGTADDITAERTYEKQESWLHISERIVDEKLSAWAEELDRYSEDPDANIDFQQMIDDVDDAVNEFALENPTLLFDALNKCL
jgi:hypothetical protein